MEARYMSICCIGQSVWDIIARIDEGLVPDRKYRIESYMECAGGPALNAACVCGTWGEPTSLVSRIGNDRYGAMIMRSLSALGIGTAGMVRDPGARTSVSLIIVNGVTGERTIFNFPSSHVDSGASIPEEGPSVILSDGHEPGASTAYIRSFPEAVSIVDAGSYRPDVLTVARESNYVVCSRAFAEQYLGRSLSPGGEGMREDLLSLGRIHDGCRIVVTLGGEGLAFLEGGRLATMPAFEVDAIDTTGAGDILHGAFAFGIDHGLGMRESLTLASMASAISVTRQGGQTSIPDLEEVSSHLEALGIETGLSRAARGGNSVGRGREGRSGTQTKGQGND
jgi:sugar/nucleoside kinase (ribokinase family)